MTSADTKPTLIDARIYEPGDYPPERGEGVRAPVAPIRIAVGAPDPLGLGVGEHDAPGGAAPCSCGAWHRGAGAEAAPLPLAAMTGCDSHSVDPRAGCAECNAIAEREEPSFRTGCAEHLRIWGRGCETCDRLRAGGEPAPLPPKPWREQTDAEQVNATKARARELGFVIRDPRDKKPMPSEPPAPTDDPGDEPPWQSAPDRAAWLMLPVSLVGNETISGPRYNELASVARGLRARVAELEAERVREPAGHRVAALLADLKRMREEGDGGMREAIEAVGEYLGAPTPLDLAVGEVCALLPREYPDGATEATRTASSKAALAALDVEEGDIIGARAQMVDAMADLLGALLACDAPATKEPG